MEATRAEKKELILPGPIVVVVCLLCFEFALVLCADLVLRNGIWFVDYSCSISPILGMKKIGE